MISYIDYSGLEEFYTIPELCDLISLEKQELRAKCEQYNINPRCDENGVWGFNKHDVCVLHNNLFYENRPGKNGKADPWK